MDRDEDNPQNPAPGEAPSRWRPTSGPAGAQDAMDGANSAGQGGGMLLACHGQNPICVSGFPTGVAAASNYRRRRAA